MAAVPPVDPSHNTPEATNALPPANRGLLARIAAAASSGLAAVASTAASIGSSAVGGLFAAPEGHLTLVPGMAGYEAESLESPEIRAAREAVQRAQLDYDLDETEETYPALQAARAYLDTLLNPPPIAEEERAAEERPSATAPLNPLDVLKSTATAQAVSAANSVVQSTVAGRAAVAGVSWAGKKAAHAAAPHVLHFVRKLTDQPLPGTTSSGAKVARILASVGFRKKNEEVYVLSEKIAGGVVSGTIPEKTLLTANSAARAAISDTEKILQASGFEEAPLIQPLMPAPAGRVLPIFEKHTLAGLKESDKALCQGLAEKAKGMSAVGILHTVILRRHLTFEQLKHFTAQKDPVKAYFAELSFFPWLVAKFTYLFISPCLNIIFDWHDTENPGLAAQLVSIVRERLSDPHTLQTFMATLLSDASKIALQGKRGRIELIPTNTNDLNNLFASWIKGRIFIKTGWPLIGPWIDHLIERSLMSVIKSQNIPKKIQGLYTPGKPNTVHPVLLELVQSLEGLTKSWMESIQASQKNTLSALERNEHEPLLDKPAGATLPPLFNDLGEPLDLKKVTKSLTDYFALQGARNPEELRELLSHSRFELHLRELQSSDPHRAKRYIAYLKELDAFLKDVGANQELRGAGTLATVSISDKIEEKVDNTLADLLKKGIASLLQTLSDENTIEAILKKAVSFAEKFLVTAELTPVESEKQRISLEKSSMALSQNVKQIISDVTEFQFKPNVQKENLEAANRYAVECLGKLKNETLRLAEQIRDLTSCLETLTSLEDIRTAKERLRKAGQEIVLLKDTFSARLQQIYTAPQGAFGDDEKMAHMSQIETSVLSLKELAIQIGHLTKDVLPRLENHFLASAALSKLSVDEPVALPPLAPYYTVLTDLEKAGWTSSNSPLSDFKGEVFALSSCKEAADKLAEKERLLETAIAATENLQKKRNLQGATLFSSTEIQEAYRASESSLKNLIKHRLLTEQALHDLANASSLAKLLGMMQAKHTDYQTERTRYIAAGLERLRILNTAILESRERIRALREKEVASCEHIRANTITNQLKTIMLKAQAFRMTSITATEALPEVNTERLQPLVDSYLSFLGTAAQTFITSSYNLHLLTEAQLERFRRTLS